MLLPLLRNTDAVGGGGPVFIGPNIDDLNLTQNALMAPIDFSTRFVGGTTFALIGGTVTGLTLSSGGVLSGTPTTLGTTAGLQIQADGSVNSDTFAINVVAPVGGNGWDNRRYKHRYNF